MLCYSAGGLPSTLNLGQTQVKHNRLKSTSQDSQVQRRQMVSHKAQSSYASTEGASYRLLCGPLMGLSFHQHWIATSLMPNRPYCFSISPVGRLSRQRTEMVQGHFWGNCRSRPVLQWFQSSVARCLSATMESSKAPMSLCTKAWSSKSAKAAGRWRPESCTVAVWTCRLRFWSQAFSHCVPSMSNFASRTRLS